MSLSEKAIKNLQKIIKQDYGQTINKEDANELGTSLLRLTKIALNHKLKANKTINKQKP